MTFAVALAMAFAIPLATMAIVIAMSVTFVSMPLLVFRHIDIVVPIIAYEIDRPVAGIVFITMLLPLFLVSRRNMEINWRRRRHTHMGGNDHNGIGIDELWPWNVSDVDLAIKTGLTDTD